MASNLEAMASNLLAMAFPFKRKPKTIAAPVLLFGLPSWLTLLSELSVPAASTASPEVDFTVFVLVFRERPGKVAGRPKKKR